MRKAAITLFFLHLAVFISAQRNHSYYYAQGVTKYSNNDYTGAIAEFTTALKYKATAKNDYKIADTYRARAFCKMYVRNYKSAIDDLEDAIKFKPEYTELYYAGVIVLTQAKQYDDGIVWADKGLALKPEYEDLLLAKAHLFFLKKDYSSAIKSLDIVLLSISPRSVEALNAKGESLMKKKDYKASSDAFTQSLEIDPQNSASFYDRGICRAYLKDFKGAVEDMNRAMAIDTGSKWVGYNNIGFFVKFEEKDYQAALELFTDAIRLNPSFAYAYSNRAYAKLKMNDLKGAREDITKSIALDPTNSWAYKTFGELLVAEKKEKQACEKWQKALDLDYTTEYDEDVNEFMKQYCK